MKSLEIYILINCAGRVDSDIISYKMQSARKHLQCTSDASSSVPKTVDVESDAENLGLW